MTFQTLEHTAVTTIANTFNEAFSDYIVPLKLSEAQLTDKIKSDSLKLDLSAGAFYNDQLAGIILHGYDMIEGQPTAYNGGTGVIPSMRGQQLTAKLYRYVLPVLKERNIRKIVLEVITTNSAAIKVYEQIGFRISRTLNCYKGAIRHFDKPVNDFVIKLLPDYDWALMQSFWDCKPSWQNAVTALEQLRSTNISIGIYDGETLTGYLIFNPKMNRVQQFAVDKHYRNRGIGRQLFAFIAGHYSNEISIINVDDAASTANVFLKDTGLEKTVMQYEMEMMLR